MAATTTDDPAVVDRPARRPVDVGRWASVALPAIVLGMAGWLRRWTTDDAFINYRIVDQIFAGHGPVFNAGERVESATSPLWLATLTLGHAVLPFDLEWVAVALSIPMAMAGVVAVSVASRRLLGGAVADDDRTVWVPAGVLVLLATTVVWDFTTAGLETGLTLAWVGVVALAVARAVDEPEALPAWGLVVIGLGPLVRPDEAITSAAALAFVVVGTWRGGHRRRALRQVAVALAIPVAFQVFRMGYYGALVPTTALAKQASVPHWAEGWAYLANFAGSYALFVPVLLLAVAAVALTRSLPARRRVAVAVLPAAAVLHTLFLVRAGGDYIHGRLLLPPLFALLAPVAVLPLRRTLAVAVPLGALVVWAGLCAGFLRPDGTRVNRSIIADGRGAIVGALGVDHPVTAADQGWGPGTDNVARLRDNAVTLDERPLAVEPAPGLATPAAALYGIGVTGYAAGTDVHVVDRLGLADPLVARFELDEPGFIAHEKPIPGSWLVARIAAPGSVVPADQVEVTGYARALYTSPAGQLDADTEVARRVLRCRPLRELRDASTAPMTPGRFLSNLWRAPGLTALAVPPDPNEAERRLC